MGLTYYFRFEAAATVRAAELASFLHGVEKEAQTMGFAPTVVVNAFFDTEERRLFARRLTTGLLIEDERLKGVRLNPRMFFTFPNETNGQCRLCPDHGVVLVVTDQRGVESAFGFFHYPSAILDEKGHEIMRITNAGGWSFSEFLKSSDARYRSIVRRFAAAGFLAEERDDFAGPAKNASLAAIHHIDPTGLSVIILSGEYAGEEGVCLGRTIDSKDLWAVSPNASERVLNLHFDAEFVVLINRNQKPGRN